MILGLLAGNVLRSDRLSAGKIKWLLAAGVVTLLAGIALGWVGVCPVIKRIWTPSWVLFSGGCCLLLLVGFYAVTDVWNHKSWAWPLIIVGTNSIAAYGLYHLGGEFIQAALVTHMGNHFFEMFGQAYAPVCHGAFTLLALWLVLVWLHRRKIFLKI